MEDQEKVPYNIIIEFNEFDMDGPQEKEFFDIVGYQVGNDVIAVLTKEGETVIYPLATVRFVRHYPA
jgi:hypothetical protein